jgi:hypothetical protein
MGTPYKPRGMHAISTTPRLGQHAVRLRRYKGPLRCNKAALNSSAQCGPGRVLSQQELISALYLKNHSPRNSSCSRKTGLATEKNPEQSTGSGLGELLPST